MRIVLLLVLLAWSGFARAETVASCKGFVDTLPATIDTPGTWCLDHDVGTGITSGAAITIAANNVTLDCNGFKIAGNTAGAGTATSGIFDNGFLNTVVRNCTLRGFRFGMAMVAGGGRLLERNRIDDSTLVGAFIQGDGSVFRDNFVNNTGPSTGYAWGVVTGGAVDVIGNTISGVVPDATAGTNFAGYGIQLADNPGSLVQGNIVRDVRDGVNGSVGLVVNDTALRVVLRANDVMYSGTHAASFGIGCAGRAPVAVAVGNTALNQFIPLFGCVDGGRNVTVVHP